LLRGEAWFEVAKDTSRPFVVSAGRARVRAVGTAFSVRRHDMGTEVLVTEGTVETWMVGAADAKIRLTAGKKAFVSDGAPAQVATAASGEIDRSLAWRQGQIALGGETLAYAVEEFNRYNERKVVIADSRLAAEKLVGQFRANQPEAFARAVAGTLGATVVESGATIRIFRSAGQ
jgi:transmembrane sensor